jgi:hypothetical protein
MQHQLSPKTSNKYYCLVGILLACMAVLLARSLGPDSSYAPDSNTVFGKLNYHSEQTVLFNKAGQLAQR